MSIALRAAMLRVFLFLIAVGALGTALQSHAADHTVRISRQFGLGFLAIHVVLDHQLIEKHAKRLGVSDVQMVPLKLSGASATNDALLSGSLELAGAGIGGLLQLWDKTGGDVKAIVSLNNMNLVLNTNDPRVRSLRDYVGIQNHKIALPAVKVSTHALVLQMGAEKQFGAGQQFILDNLTVSLPHPTAYAALVGGRSEVRSHFAALPYSYLELNRTKGDIRTVLSLYDVLGGPGVNTLLYTSRSWAQKNPQLLQAVFSAFEEGSQWIAANPKGAAEVFKRVTNSKLNPSDIEAMISNDKMSDYSIQPARTLVFAEFMHKVGRLKRVPKTWKDYFWDIAHQMNGS